MTPQADDRAALSREWLRTLRERGLTWVRAGLVPRARTENYVDLAFAFGAARVGDRAAAEAPLDEHRPILTAGDQAHRAMFLAYEYRIRQALDGEPHAGPLPKEQMESLDRMDRLDRYVVDRLRKHSRIIAPGTTLNPYRHWGARINEFEKALAELADWTDSAGFEPRIATLLNGASPAGNAFRVWRMALARRDLAPPDLLRRATEETREKWSSPGGETEIPALIDRCSLLELALLASAQARWTDLAGPLLEAAGVWIPVLPHAAGRLIRTTVDVMYEFGLLDHAEAFINSAAVTVNELPTEGISRSIAQLALAEGWYRLRREPLAERMISDAARALVSGQLLAREQTMLATAFASGVRYAPQPIADQHLTTLFGEMGNVRDTYTTSSHFCISTLEVLETIVLSAVNVCRITDTWNIPSRG